MASRALISFPPEQPGVAQTDPSANPGSLPDSLQLTGLLHDARNLVTALRLAAELLGEPGVLVPEHAHHAAEIALMSEGASRLLRRLTSLIQEPGAPAAGIVEAPVTDLAVSLRQLGGLLSAMAGPKIVVQTACLPCAGSLRLSEENLTRILLNLIRNAADAMPEGGRIRLSVQQGGGASFFWTLPEGSAPGEAAQTVVLSVEDGGPGIPAAFRERVFEPGFSTRRDAGGWTETRHRGLGLSIVRQLVEEAGGSIRAGASPLGGARFEMEWPLTNVTPPVPSEPPILSGRRLP